MHFQCHFPMCCTLSVLGLKPVTLSHFHIKKVIGRLTEV